jgi:hypothetical protein
MAREELSRHCRDNLDRARARAGGHHRQLGRAETVGSWLRPTPDCRSAAATIGQWSSTPAKFWRRREAARIPVAHATCSRQTRQISGPRVRAADLARSNVVPPPVAISGPTNPAPKIFSSRPAPVSCRRFGRAQFGRAIENGPPAVGARYEQRTRSFENDCRVARPLGFSKLRIPSPAP